MYVLVQYLSICCALSSHRRAYVLVLKYFEMYLSPCDLRGNICCCLWLLVWDGRIAVKASREVSISHKDAIVLIMIKFCSYWFSTIKISFTIFSKVFTNCMILDRPD